MTHVAERKPDHTRAECYWYNPADGTEGYGTAPFSDCPIHGHWPPCTHEDFLTTVTIVRLTEVEDGPVTAFAAEVTMSCQFCHEPFVFVGAPVGLLPSQPTVSADGKEMHLPVRPASRPDMIGRLGYVLRTPGEPSSSRSGRQN